MIKRRIHLHDDGTRSVVTSKKGWRDAVPSRHPALQNDSSHNWVVYNYSITILIALMACASWRYLL